MCGGAAVVFTVGYSHCVRITYKGFAGRNYIISQSPRCSLVVEAWIQMTTVVILAV